MSAQAQAYTGRHWVQRMHRQLSLPMLEFDQDVLNSLNAATWQGRPLSSLTDEELDQVIAAEEAGASATTAALASREALKKSLAKWDFIDDELSGDCGAEPPGDGA